MPRQAGSARARFVDGAPSLETIINGVPQDIGLAYLQLNGSTVASSFAYGTFTLKTSSLTGGNFYTLVVVGSFPNYRVLTFQEPKSSSGAQLSFYEASPAVPSADFGSFRASSFSNFKKLGSARLGNVATVSLGSSVSNIGGFAGPASAPIGTVKPVQINSFDSRNALPFHNIGRLSLFLFDMKAGSIAPVFGSLDR